MKWTHTHTKKKKKKKKRPGEGRNVVLFAEAVDNGLQALVASHALHVAKRDGQLLRQVRPKLSHHNRHLRDHREKERKNEKQYVLKKKRVRQDINCQPSAN